jgi:chromosome segregation ATPase
MYIRPTNNVRDMGLSSMKSVKELEQELKQMENMLRSSEEENKRALEKLQELEGSRSEMEDLSNYYLRKANAAKEELEAKGETVSVDVLLASLRTMEQDLDYLKQAFP